MKKIIVSIISLLLLCTISFNFTACMDYNFGGQEHDVVLVLVNKDGTKTRKILTSWEKGATIYNPSEY